MSALNLEALAKTEPNLVFMPEEAEAVTLAEILVALANERGGSLIIGLSSQQKLGKLPDPATTRDRLMNVALQCDPPLIITAPTIQSYKNKSVLVVQIPPDLPHVYNYDGRYVIWAEGEVKPLSGHLLRQLIFSRGESGFEQTVVAGATQHTLNWEAALAYARSVEGLNHLSPEEVLLKRGCLKEDGSTLRPTRAGMLLFGLDPQRWLPNSGITMVRYTGLQMSDSFIRADIQGTLSEQARKAEAFVLDNISRDVKIESLQRADDYIYPLGAVREVIINAIAHRDYSVQGDNIRLLLFANRLECYNPGRLPGHVTINNIQEERFSRNAAIVQVLFDLGFIERLGYGINRVIRAMVERGLPQPEMTEMAAGFKITLYNDLSTAQNLHQDSIRQWMALGLNERQIAALGYLNDNGRITNTDYQTLCPTVSPETLRRDLADLVDRDMLLRIGEKRATFYILK